MPITPTYPDVYIEELPSTVHTIVGVATSITAFVGYTKRGPSDRSTTVFSYGDFERAFGGLDPDCPLTYAVSQFYANGGSQAVIVRVASGDAPATLSIANKTGGGGTVEVLTLTASSSGSWANPLEVQVDYGTLNPDSLFNVTVTEYAVSGGALVAAASESFRNLTMNSYAPTYAVDVITAGSKLVIAGRGGGIPASPGAGYSESGELPAAQTTAAGQRLALSVNGEAAFELVLDAGSNLNNVRDRINTALTNASVTDVTASVIGPAGHKRLQLLSSTNDERSSVHVLPASASDVAPTLMLGVANGGTEVDGVAGFNPAATGTVGGALTTTLVLTLPDAIDASASDKKIKVAVTANGTTTGPFEVLLLPQTKAFATKEDLRAGLQNALQAAAALNPDVAAELLGAQVTIAADHLVVSAAGRADTTIAITDDAADDTATKIGFGTTAGIITNVSAYSPATSAATLAQLASTPGSDGTAPGASDVIGQENLNTGIYALSHVDLFNLLVLPDKVSTDTSSVVSAAMTYCENRRAFLIVDTPPRLARAGCPARAHRGGRSAHPARTAGRSPDRRRTVEQRDRAEALHRAPDGEEPRAQHPAEARRVAARAGGGAPDPPLALGSRPMHLRPPAFDHGVVSFLWGLFFGLFIWIGGSAVGYGSAMTFIIGAVVGFVTFLFVRVYGEEEPRRP